jgi:hypothetical protein
MAWREVLIPMVRAMIGDLGDPQRYDDSRIEQAILTGGLIASQEYPFDTTYSFDFSAAEILPDPTESSTLDNEAIALFGLKAACILSVNDYQRAVGAGIRVRDGDSEVDTTGRFKGYSDIINVGPCASYTKLLLSLQQRASMVGGGAVSSPYSTSVDTWGVRSVNGIWHIRGYDYWLNW